MANKKKNREKLAECVSCKVIRARRGGSNGIKKGNMKVFAMFEFVSGGGGTVLKCSASVLLIFLRIIIIENGQSQMQKLYKIATKWRGYGMQTSFVCLAIYNFLWFSSLRVRSFVPFGFGYPIFLSPFVFCILSLTSLIRLAAK